MEPEKGYQSVSVGGEGHSVQKEEGQRKNIPVICNSTRVDEGTAKKPQGIHLNPKFFKTAPGGEQRKQVRYGVRPGPPMRHEEYHGQGHRSSQLPPPRYEEVNYNQPQQFNDYHPPFSMGPAPQRYPPAYPYGPPPSQNPRNRPPFTSDNGPRYHGQGFPPSRFHFSNNGEWQGPRFHPYSQNNPESIHPPPPAPAFQQKFFPPSHSQWGMGGPPMQPEFHQGFHHAPPPTDYWQHRNEPQSPPSYYNAYRDDYDDRDRKSWSNERKRRRLSRSRSRSSSRESRRSRSLSSASYSMESRRDRKSRSLSKESHRKDKSSSSDSDSESEGELIWDSNEEYNSDSDLDLSKPLDTLASDVSSSKALLKSALKCLGPSKVQTMIPLELSQVSRGKLFGMCRKLLDEMDNENLVKVLEGTLTAKDHEDKKCSEKSAHSSSPNDDTETDKERSPVRRKVDKKKKSKKKRKKKRKKKHRESNSDTESETEKESQESVLEEDGDDKAKNSENESTVVTAETSAPKPDTASGTTTQQSLLELIQIEYKTKAINVMLKHLGVANEISSLVSDVLQTNGIAAVQGVLTDQQIMEISRANAVAATVSTTMGDKKEQASDEQVETVTTSAHYEYPESDKESGGASNDIDNETDGVNGTITMNDAKRDTKTNETTHDDVKNVPYDNELIKDLDEDVLDLEVGAGDELDFLDED